MGVLDTLAHLQVAMSHLVRSFMAVSLPSVSGLTSSHQLISSSSNPSSQVHTLASRRTPHHPALMKLVE